MPAWYVRIDSETIGPLQPSEVKQLVASGRIDAQTPVRRDDLDQWVNAGRVKGLLPSAAPSSPAVDPIAASLGVPAGASIFKEEGQPSEPQAAVDAPATGSPRPPGAVGAEPRTAGAGSESSIPTPAAPVVGRKVLILVGSGIGAVILLLLAIIVILITGGNEEPTPPPPVIAAGAPTQPPQSSTPIRQPEPAPVKSQDPSTTRMVATAPDRVTANTGSQPGSPAAAAAPAAPPAVRAELDPAAIAALDDAQLEAAYREATDQIREFSRQRGEQHRQRREALSKATTDDERARIEADYRESAKLVADRHHTVSVQHRAIAMERSRRSRQRQQMSVTSTRPTARPEPPPEPAAPDHIRTILDLPGEAYGAAIAQGGRSIAILTKQSDALVVVDSETEQLRSATLSTPATGLAAGGDRAIVFSTDRDLLVAYDLTSCEELGKAPNPLPGPLLGVAMHRDSGERALLVGLSPNGGRLVVGTFDVESRRLVGEAREVEGNSSFISSSVKLRAVVVNSDFSQCALTRSNSSPSGVYHIDMRGGEDVTPVVHYDHTTTRLLDFGPRGLHTTAGIYHLDAADTRTRNYDPVHEVSATPVGDLSVVFPTVRTSKGGSPFDVHDPAGETKLMRWVGWEGFSAKSGRRELLLNQRFGYHPDLHRLAMVDDDGKRVAIADFDPLGDLEEMGVGYVFATSTPPSIAYAGSTWRYKPTVVASGPVDLRLETGPEGMRVVDGELVWSVPSQGSIPSGLRVLVTYGAGKASSTQLFSLGYRRRLAIGEQEIALARDAFGNLSADLGPGNPVRFTHSRDGSRAWMWSQQVIVEIAADSPWPKGRATPLEDPYGGIAYRDGIFICMNASHVDFVEEGTGRLMGRVDCPGVSFNWMDLDPTDDVTYVTYRDGSDSNQLTQYRIGRLDERTRAITPLESGFGRTIAVSRDGKRLYANLKGYWTNSVTINGLYGPEGILTRSTSADVVVGYDIRRRSLHAFSANERAGENGYFVYVSPHDERVSFVSGGGSKDIRGYHVPAMDPNDLTSVGTSYHLGAYPGGLKCNPRYDLVAGWNRETVTLLRASDGKVLKSGLKLWDGQGRSNLTGWTWTPDGKHMLVVLDDTERESSKRRYHLVTMDLPLGEAVLESLELSGAPRYVPRDRVAPPAGRTTVGPGAAPEEAVEPMRRREVNALYGKNRGSMDTQEVAERYADATVLIFSDGGTGSGFFIGSRGAILTCAHVIPRAGRTMARFNRAGSNEQQTVPVEVVAVDREHDLALLRVPMPDLRVEHVKLDLQADVKMGQDLRIIGNPGLGDDRVLDRTMTEGIVSSPDRDIDGLSYIQTNAAVNPGSSGSPVFNQDGNVVGVVVLKATIEGAGFVVSPERVEAFLERHLK